MILETIGEIDSSMPSPPALVELQNEIESYAQTIKAGLKKMLDYFITKWGNISEDDSLIHELENHRLRINSVEMDSNDQDGFINSPPEAHLGFVLPVSCGHRGYPKKKRIKAFDLFLHNNGFTSRSKCDRESADSPADD